METITDNTETLTDTTETNTPDVKQTTQFAMDSTAYTTTTDQAPSTETWPTTAPPSLKMTSLPPDDVTTIPHDVTTTTTIWDFPTTSDSSTEGANDVTTMESTADPADNLALIIGCSLGAAVLIVVLILAVLLARKRRAKKARRQRQYRDNTKEVTELQIPDRKPSTTSAVPRELKPDGTYFAEGLEDSRTNSGIDWLSGEEEVPGTATLDPEASANDGSPKSNHEHSANGPAQDSDKVVLRNPSSRPSALGARALQVQSRYSMGPVYLDDDEGGTHNAYDNMYQTAKSFKR